MTTDVRGLIAEITRDVETAKGSRDSFRRFTGRSSVTSRRKLEVVSNHAAVDQRIAELSRLLDQAEALTEGMDVGMHVRRIRAQVPHGALSYKAVPDHQAVLA